MRHDPDLAHVCDPAEDGSTLESVVARLTARVSAARYDKNLAVRWWYCDLAIWQGRKRLAIIRPD